MAREESTAKLCGISKKRSRVSLNETLPTELVSGILARVAASSFTDLFNAKLSCILFEKLAHEDNIYQHISLERFPIVEWTSRSDVEKEKKKEEEKEKEKDRFLKRCWVCENPELLYRKAVMAYFNKNQVESAMNYLEKAKNVGHVGALYLRGIILLLSTNNEQKQAGIILISSMKKTRSLRTKLQLARDNLISMLSKIWVEKPLVQPSPVCCMEQHCGGRTNSWLSENADAEDYISCEACIADRELDIFINRSYNQGT